MRWLAVVEWSLIALAAAGVITQVLWPLAAGRPLFPLFRRERRALESQLEEARERADERELKKEILREVRK